MITEVQPVEELKTILMPEYGWTQKSLAQKLNISPQFLSDVLRGRRNVGKEILKGLNMEQIISYRYKN